MYQEKIDAKNATKFNMPVVYYSQLLSVVHGTSANESGLDGQIIRDKKQEDIADKLSCWCYFKKTLRPFFKLTIFL